MTRKCCVGHDMPDNPEEADAYCLFTSADGVGCGYPEESVEAIAMLMSNYQVDKDTLQIVKKPKPQFNTTSKAETEAREDALAVMKAKSGLHPATDLGSVGSGCMSADDILKSCFHVEKPVTQLHKDKARAMMEKMGHQFCKCNHEVSISNTYKNEADTIMCMDCKLPIFEQNVKILPHGL